MYQQSLKNSCRMVGLGLHNGTEVAIAIHPAKPNHGIVFRVQGENGPVDIPAHASFIVDTTLNTTLGKDGARLHTVEHLMAAFRGLGIDNALVEVSGNEVPAADGSAHPFVTLLLQAGIHLQPASRRYMKIKTLVEVKTRTQLVSLRPSPQSSYTATIDFQHPLIHSQSIKFSLSAKTFTSDLARARTYGFEEDLNHLHTLDRALGASLDNAVGLDKNGNVLNIEGLRYSDEFVRHKILDAIGDLFLLGYPLLGAYRGVRAGHALHHELMQTLFARPDAWELVTDPLFFSIAPIKPTIQAPQHLSTQS